MESLKCKLCGGTLVMDNSGEFARCEYCGTKYQNELLQRMIIEIKGNIKVEGIDTVEKLIEDILALYKLKEYGQCSHRCSVLVDKYPGNYKCWEISCRYSDPTGRLFTNTQSFEKYCVLAPAHDKRIFIEEYNQYWSKMALKFRDGEFDDYYLTHQNVGIDTDANQFIKEIIESRTMIENAKEIYAKDSYKNPTKFEWFLGYKSPIRYREPGAFLYRFIDLIHDDEDRSLIIKYKEKFKIYLYINDYTLIIDYYDYNDERKLTNYRMKYPIKHFQLRDMISKALYD